MKYSCKTRNLQYFIKGVQTKLNERNGTEKKKQVNIIWHINREGTLTYNNEFDYRIK